MDGGTRDEEVCEKYLGRKEVSIDIQGLRNDGIVMMA